MRNIFLAALVATAAVSLPADAGKPKQVRYVGIHPVPKSEGGGFCYIEAPHVHIFAANKLEYRDHRGHNHFVGDPVAYGYDGPKHAYRGHHPIHVHAVVGDEDNDVEFCYLDGPHYHYFEAPESPEFKVVGDAYFYVGEPGPVYVEARPAMIKVNAIYTPLVYTRPVIEVEPPEGWIGVRFGVAPVVVAPVAAVEVRGPAVRVVAPSVRIVVPPPPSIRVDVGIGVGFSGSGKVKYKGKKGKRRGW
ncbi:MAG: hypothetical protein H0T46_22055 [Deltaproteobacteria bacterium]|nr:hypothetical protein [Deltaproteobacteria bacterium]